MKETESSPLFVHFEQKVWAESADKERLDLKVFFYSSSR